MVIYVLESDDFVKVGASKSIENRVSTHWSNFKIKRSEFFDIGEEYCESKAMFIESCTSEQFGSETEYLDGAVFEEVVEAVKNLIDKSPSTPFGFSVIGGEILYNSDGYIDMTSVIKYASNRRTARGLPLPRFDVYAKSESFRDFYSRIESATGKRPVVGKRGAYGGTYAFPYIMLDYLQWVDAETKVKTYEFMFTDEYVKLMRIMPYFSKRGL